MQILINYYTGFYNANSSRLIFSAQPPMRSLLVLHLLLGFIFIFYLTNITAGLHDETNFLSDADKLALILSPFVDLISCHHSNLIPLEIDRWIDLTKNMYTCHLHQKLKLDSLNNFNLTNPNPSFESSSSSYSSEVPSFHGSFDPEALLDCIKGELPFNREKLKTFIEELNFLEAQNITSFQVIEPNETLSAKVQWLESAMLDIFGRQYVSADSNDLKVDATVKALNWSLSDRVLLLERLPILLEVLVEAAKAYEASRYFAAMMALAKATGLVEPFFKVGKRVNQREKEVDELVHTGKIKLGWLVPPSRNKNSFVHRNQASSRKEPSLSDVLSESAPLFSNTFATVKDEVFSNFTHFDDRE